MKGLVTGECLVGFLNEGEPFKITFAAEQFWTANKHAWGFPITRNCRNHTLSPAPHWLIPSTLLKAQAQRCH